MSTRIAKKWKIKQNDAYKDVIEAICASMGCSKILASLIVNRGYTDVSEAISFVSKNQEVLHDPFLLNGMDIAVDRILKAVKDKEKITVFGDYDVDGVTSVSILYLYLERAGANVEYYIPSRMKEGYGVSSEAIKKLSDGGTKLIITVDTGVTAHEEVSYAKSLGIDVVITDHHECTDVLPDAVAVINPKRHDTTYPFASLAGVGVVFKLLCALESVRAGVSIIDATREIANSYSDLTAIGTIADVMPVVDENRIIISIGLKKAETTDKIGLQTLLNICKNGEGKAQTRSKQKKKLSSGFVAFTLAPRINAAGRISTADIAVELFLSKDASLAEKYANELCRINRERQLSENTIADCAFLQVENNKLESNNIIVLDDVDWHHGVIGIVASRVTEKYAAPSILISFEGNDDPYDMEAIGKGSGRSISGMNLVDALSSCSHLLERYGGHELAAGLTIKRKNLLEFKKSIEEYAKKCFDGSKREQTLLIDAELECEDMTLDTANELCYLEPYGVSNPTPVFSLRNMIISDVSPVGMNRHLRITLQKSGYTFTSMLFSTSIQEFPYDIHDEVDIAFNLDINEFNGTSNLQISLKDIRLSERISQNEQMNLELYNSVRSGECTLDSSYIIPERDEFALVYKFLLDSTRMGKDTYRVSRLLTDMSRIYSYTALNYIKLKIIISVFRELNIVSIEEIDDFTFSFNVQYGRNKTSLDKSNILKRLRTMYPKK